MAFGLSAGAIGAIAGVGGALISSGASSKAAKAQSAASDASVAEQRRQFDRTEQLQAPFRAGGEAGLNELLRLYGLRPGGGGAVGGKSRAQLRSDIAGQFTTAGGAGQWIPAASGGGSAESDAGAWQRDGYFEPGTAGTVNEAGLTNEVERLFAEQQAAQATAQADPGYGSAMRDFTAAEIQMDPGYEFGRQQGQQAIDRKISAGGGRISGAAIKAAGQYGNDYATQGYSTAYNRKNQSRSDRIGRLQSLAGMAVTGAQQVGQAGQVMANNVSNTMQSQGDATAANRLNQGNIWSNAGNQIASLYSRQNSMPSYINPNTGAGFGYGANYDK